MNDDDKKKFDFSDVLNAPGMKQLIQESIMSSIAKGASFASQILPILVNTAIEVLSFNRGHGDAWQEPGDVHWLPGIFNGAVHDDEFTACGERATGMVTDKKPPEKISCERCQEAYVAWRLRSERE